MELDSSQHHDDNSGLVSPEPSPKSPTPPPPALSEGKLTRLRNILDVGVGIYKGGAREVIVQVQTGSTRTLQQKQSLN